MSEPVSDPRLDQLVDLIVELSSGDLTVRATPSEARDTIDAVMVGINLMADELELMYADLEARVVERTAQLERAQGELQRMALIDGLTGLANRTHLADRLEQAIVRSADDDWPPSVILLDLDEFKTINDSLGHSVGDRVLEVIGRRLKSLVRDTDTVARLGGDEFAILLQNVPEDYVLRVAQRALDALHRPVQLEDRALFVRSSIGVRFGVRGQSAEDLIRDADTAMYEAKSHGKGMVQVFEPSMHRASQERLRTLSALDAAIAAEELDLHFQPIVRLRDGSIVGAEALLRWTHPALGPVAPAEFVALAEESGRINEIGAWVLDRAVCVLAGWLRNFPGDAEFALHVNVSPVQLRRAALADDVTAVLARHGVDPVRLALEVSETGLTAGDARAVETLYTIRDRGVAIHIDDFGTGYSSIAALRRLPLDAVKVDQALAGAVLGTSEDRTFVRAVLQLIEAAGLHVIVEGVETDEQLTALREIGAEFGQGYHFGAPMPADHFAAFLERQIASPGIVDRAPPGPAAR